VPIVRICPLGMCVRVASWRMNNFHGRRLVDGIDLWMDWNLDGRMQVAVLVVLLAGDVDVRIETCCRHRGTIVLLRSD